LQGGGGSLARPASAMIRPLPAAGFESPFSAASGSSGGGCGSASASAASQPPHRPSAACAAKPTPSTVSQNRAGGGVDGAETAAHGQRGEDTEERSPPPHELRRYTFYVDGGVATAVLPLPEAWLRNVLRRVPCVATHSVQVMLAEAREDFCRASRRALLEYVLRSESEVARLALPSVAAALRRARERRAQDRWPREECRAPVSWHARVELAAGRLQLGQLHPALLALAAAWVPHEGLAFLQVCACMCMRHPVSPLHSRVGCSWASYTRRCSRWRRRGCRTRAWPSCRYVHVCACVTQSLLSTLGWVAAGPATPGAARAGGGVGAARGPGLPAGVCMRHPVSPLHQVLMGRIVIACSWARRWRPTERSPCRWRRLRGSKGMRFARRKCGCGAAGCRRRPRRRGW
jgi:hypothetical protein